MVVEMMWCREDESQVSSTKKSEMRVSVGGRKKVRVEERRSGLCSDRCACLFDNQAGGQPAAGRGGARGRSYRITPTSDEQQGRREGVLCSVLGGRMIHWSQSGFAKGRLQKHEAGCRAPPPVLGTPAASKRRVRQKVAATLRLVSYRHGGAYHAKGLTGCQSEQRHESGLFEEALEESLECSNKAL